MGLCCWYLSFISNFSPLSLSFYSYISVSLGIPISNGVPSLFAYSLQRPVYFTVCTNCQFSLTVNFSWIWVRTPCLSDIVFIFFLRWQIGSTICSLNIYEPGYLPTCGNQCYFNWISSVKFSENSFTGWRWIKLLVKLLLDLNLLLIQCYVLTAWKRTFSSSVVCITPRQQTRGTGQIIQDCKRTCRLSFDAMFVTLYSHIFPAASNWVSGILWTQKLL